MTETGEGRTPAAGAKGGLAEQIVAACRLLVGEELAGGFGHVSVRIGSGYAISGKVPLGTITAAEVVHVTDVGPEAERAHLLPVEAAIHRAVYDARPDVGAIVRTHGEYCSVLSILGEPIRPVHAFGATLGAEVPVDDVCELIEDEGQAARVASVLGKAAAVAMRGNGQVVCGADLVEACVLAVYLEESARLQHRARAIHGPGNLRYLGDAEIGPAAANLGSHPQLARAFKALCDRHEVAFPAGR